jgi:hypothetical protein
MSGANGLRAPRRLSQVVFAGSPDRHGPERSRRPDLRPCSGSCSWKNTRLGSALLDQAGGLQLQGEQAAERGDSRTISVMGPPGTLSTERATSRSTPVSIGAVDAAKLWPKYVTPRPLRSALPSASTSVPPTDRTSVMMSATVWRRASRLPTALARPVADEPSVLLMAVPSSPWSTPRPYAGSERVVVPLVTSQVLHWP